jgi:HD-GYP domain-containing protein (c-di-GMP phosphodiesterase class II)
MCTQPDKLESDSSTIYKEIFDSILNCKNEYIQFHHHHEFWDGSGYPDRLRRDRIPLISRIISLVDSYDAITETRPYRKTLRHDQALEIMQREVGTKFDPYLSKLFFKTISDLISTNDSP